MHDWLPVHVKLGRFQAYGNNVYGMSLIMLEGHMLNINRCIQLYTAVECGQTLFLW